MICDFLSIFPFLLFINCTQDAVDKGRGRFPAELLGQLNRFVDDHLRRRIAVVKFVNGETQDSQVNPVKFVDGPGRSGRADFLVEGTFFGQNFFGQLVSMGLAGVAFGEEGFRRFPPFLVSWVSGSFHYLELAATP